MGGKGRERESGAGVDVAMAAMRMAALCANSRDASHLKRPQARPPRPPRPAGGEEGNERGGSWRDAQTASTTSAPWWADAHVDGANASHPLVHAEQGGGGDEGGEGTNGLATSRPFQLGGRTFYAAEDMTAYFRKILNKTRTGAFLPHAEHAMVMELLQRGHRTAKEKLGPGVSGVTVLPHPQYPDTRCFHLVRVDGTYADFSYRKCVRNITEHTWDSGIVDGTQEMAVGRCENVEQVQRLMDAAVECVDASVLAQALKAMANMVGTGKKLETALVDRRYLKAETMVTYTLENTGKEDAVKLLRALRDTKHRPEEMLDGLADNLEMQVDNMEVDKVREVLDCYVQLENKQRGLLHKIEERLMKEKESMEQRKKWCRDLLAFAMLEYKPRGMLEVMEKDGEEKISEQGAREITELLWALTTWNLEGSKLYAPALCRLVGMVSRASSDQADLEEEEVKEIARAYFFLLQQPLLDLTPDPSLLLWAAEQLDMPSSAFDDYAAFEALEEGLRSLCIPFERMCTTPFGPCPGLVIATESKGVVLYLQNLGIGLEDVPSYIPRESVGHRILEGKGWACVGISLSEWDWAVKGHPGDDEHVRYLSQSLSAGLELGSVDELVCLNWERKLEDPDVAC